MTCESVGFQFVFPRLMVLGLVVAGSIVFLCCIRFPVVGLEATGFEVLGSATSNSEAVWFKQHQVHRTDTAEPTSFTGNPVHNAAEPDVGGAAGLCRAVSGRHNNQPFLIIN